MKFVALIVGCLVVVGCKNPTKDLEALADRACECADADMACGNKVMADLSAFAESNSSPGTPAFNRAGIRLNDCLMSAGVKPRELTAALEKMAR